MTPYTKTIMSYLLDHKWSSVQEAAQATEVPPKAAGSILKMLKVEGLADLNVTTEFHPGTKIKKLVRRFALTRRGRYAAKKANEQPDEGSVGESEEDVREPVVHGEECGSQPERSEEPREDREGEMCMPQHQEPVLLESDLREEEITTTEEQKEAVEIPVKIKTPVKRKKVSDQSKSI